jgi:hypothetical protein
MPLYPGYANTNLQLPSKQPRLVINEQDPRNQKPTPEASPGGERSDSRETAKGWIGQGVRVQTLQILSISPRRVEGPWEQSETRIVDDCPPPEDGILRAIYIYLPK